MRPFLPGWAVLTLLLPAPDSSLRAQSPPAWGSSFLLGASRWPGLETPVFRSDQLDPLARRRFDASGSNLEVAVFRESGSAGGGLRIGGEFGVLWHESPTGSSYRNLATGATQQSRAALNAGHVTASLHLLRQGTHFTLLLGAGAGLYMLVFKESFGGWVVETSSHSYAPGGFLAGGVEVHKADRALAFRMEAQSHFVSFGGTALQGARLGGPIHTFRIGIVLRPRA
jgi:hypothetical protein